MDSNYGENGQRLPGEGVNLLSRSVSGISMSSVTYDNKETNSNNNLYDNRAIYNNEDSRSKQDYYVLDDGNQTYSKNIKETNSMDYVEDKEVQKQNFDYSTRAKSLHEQSLSQNNNFNEVNMQRQAEEKIQPEPIRSQSSNLELNISAPNNSNIAYSSHPIDNFIENLRLLRDSLGNHIERLQTIRNDSFQNQAMEVKGNVAQLQQEAQYQNQNNEPGKTLYTVRGLNDALKAVTEQYSNILAIGSRLVGNVHFQDATPSTNNSLSIPPRYSSSTDSMANQSQSSAYYSNNPKYIIKSNHNGAKQPILIPKECLRQMNIGNGNSEVPQKVIIKKPAPKKVGFYKVTMKKRPFNIALSQDTYCVTKTFKNLSKKYGIKEGDQLLEVNGKAHSFEKELKGPLPITMKFCRRF